MPIAKFYKSVDLEPLAGGEGWSLLLDGKPARTPKRALLASPTQELGQAIAAEWRDAPDPFEPTALRLTRLLSTALDRAAEAPTWRKEILRYLNTDYICYPADKPDALVARQNEIWSPLRGWFSERFGVALRIASGFTVAEQDPKLMNAADTDLTSRTDLELVAIKAACEVTGSAVLAFYLADYPERLSDVWRAARLDEDYQIEQWGEDEEASERAENLYTDLKAAATVIAKLR
ncbi:MAG: ATP12 family protein [Pseudomonadota bacterium]